MTDREYLEAFERDVDAKLLKRDGSLDSLSVSERLFVVRRAFQWEVNNGGLWTVFYNSPGGFAPDILIMLRTIAAPEAAELVAKAITVFGISGPAPDILERRKQMKDFSASQVNEIDHLTSDYFRLEDKGLTTADLLDAYLLARWRSAS